jgi:tetratricopeptide (TPR) repeat protein
LTYFDENSAIYLRQGYAPQVPALDIGQCLAQKGLHPLAGNEIFQCMNVTGVTDPFQSRDYPMGFGSEGLFALLTGNYVTAQALFAEQLRIAGDGYPEIFFNLGVASLHLQQWEAGRACLNKVLKLDPGNTEAKRMLIELDQAHPPLFQ